MDYLLQIVQNAKHIQHAKPAQMDILKMQQSNAKVVIFTSLSVVLAKIQISAITVQTIKEPFS